MSIIKEFVVIIFLIGSLISNAETTYNISNDYDLYTPVQLEVAEKDKSVSITAVGDAMVHIPQFKSAFNGTTYDFNPVFEDVKPYIENADISIVNLETTLTGTGKYTGYPTFSSPYEFADALKNAGFDIFSTANNHSLDKRFIGVKKTLDYLDLINVSHTGTARTQEEQNNILIKTVNNVKIGFLSYTYGTNGIPIPKENPYIVNILREDCIIKDITYLKSQNVDLIVSNVHFGDEYQRKQNKYQEYIVDFLIKNDVKIVFGSHSHVLQPMEIYKTLLEDGTEKEGFVIYSLGNFISDQRMRYKNTSVIVNVDCEIRNGKVEIKKSNIFAYLGR